ncbi:MAG: Teichoic acid translocation permease protein TagG [Parcubacteria group bacterium ADurb.Bin159]|jgi:ABC-type polysaccharide/polyol phosphate export permease|nr:MAG: Teichoic acid translocation permease protein TagG [Parcubacteria group bacterium ADurb.Bin159]
MLKKGLNLAVVLAKMEFKLRNEGSYLGIFWYLLNPILTFFVLLIVFGNKLGQNIPNYSLYLLLGIIMFNFFRQVTIESTKIIQDNRWLIKSINFPREILINSIILKTLFSHIFEIILFTALLFIFKAPFWGIIFYPLILLFFCFFIYGFSLILSSLAIYFIDLNNIWLFAISLIWLGTPIFYTIENQGWLFKLNLLNPCYYFITIARDLIIYTKSPEIWMVLGAIFYSLLFLIIGKYIFSKLKYKFAELI